MREFLYTMFISNNRASFCLWWNENLLKHQRVSKYYENDCCFNTFCQCLCKYHLFLHKQWSYLYRYNKFLLFLNILVLHNHTEIHTLQFYSDLILRNLNKQAYSLIFEFFSFVLKLKFLMWAAYSVLSRKLVTCFLTFSMFSLSGKNC